MSTQTQHTPGPWMVAPIEPWAPPNAKWMLFFRDAVLLPEPIPMRGAGGMWRIPAIAVGTDADPNADPGPWAVDWALEQWRKARGK